MVRKNHYYYYYFYYYFMLYSQVFPNFDFSWGTGTVNILILNNINGGKGGESISSKLHNMLYSQVFPNFNFSWGTGTINI